MSFPGVTFWLGVFADDSPATRLYSERVMMGALRFLTWANEEYLRRFPETPTIYNSGVRYAMEAPHTENWEGIAKILEIKTGDCEDLACARAAELNINRAENTAHKVREARPLLLRKQRGDIVLYHVIVEITHTDGSVTTEDPSARLGMKG